LSAKMNLSTNKEILRGGAFMWGGLEKKTAIVSGRATFGRGREKGTVAWGE